MSEISERWRLTFWHQIATVIGIPLIVLMGSIIGWFMTDKIATVQDSIKTLSERNEVMLAAIGRNQQDIAVNETADHDRDRRISALEDWRANWQGFERPSPPNLYRKN